MTTILTLVLVLSVVSGDAFAQTSQVAPEFEVASVKPTARSPMRTETGTVLPKPIITPARVEFPSVTLQALLGVAYRIKPYQLIGPTWSEKIRYDVLAKLPSDGKVDDVPLMLRALLKERFH